MLADLAALEQLDDASLWAIAKGHQPTTEITRYDQLLDRNREGVLTDAERAELTTVRTQADRFMLCKAQAAALLRSLWASSPSSCITSVSAYIPTALKTQIEQCDRHRCCYCWNQAAISGISLSFDHSQPQSQGGSTSTYSRWRS